MSDTYSVVVTGNLITGFDLESVQDSLSELFKISQEKVKPFLLGKPKVLKRNTDHKTAARYKSRIEQLGASVELHKNPLLSKETQESSNAATKTKKDKKARKLASHQSVIDKMQQQSGLNLIEQGRLKQKYKMETVDIAKESVNLWLIILAFICILFGAVDFTLSYLEFLTITNTIWLPIVSAIVGGVMLKSSFEN
jgi:hypothetical protein